MKHAVIKKERDMVANAIEDIAVGEEFCWETGGVEHSLTARTEIPFAFKVALRDIAENEEIICYGEPIGVATCRIAAGECVHVHNVRGRRAGK
jgi:altronate dehydratase small subunit